MASLDNTLMCDEHLKTITRLRFALLKYGYHFEDCPQRPCTCGFLAEWQAANLPATLGDAVDEIIDLKDFNYEDGKNL